MSRFRFTAQEQAALAAVGGDDPYSVALRRGTLELGYYTPVGADHQQPHEQDEVYVIVSGRGSFLNGGVVTDFAPGDALFVPAGVEHRFLDFTDDTQMWVIFYGPAGGESPGS
jgi:mannose-6-phosphate isomerase-like protein (cupin superfamily)